VRKERETETERERERERGKEGHRGKKPVGNKVVTQEPAGA
jgi:hypothetical protein